MRGDDPSVISVSEDTDVEDVRHLLIERRIRRVPVISEPGRALTAADRVRTSTDVRRGCAPGRRTGR
ncbi:MAG: CBS domain-containing protein [Streptosporangiaceae bacterium]